MRRFIVIFIVVGILTALVVAAVISFRRGQARVVVLPDGTRIELLGVAVAGQTFSTEKPWEKKARKILPRAWQNWISTPMSSSCGSGTNSITVYFKVQFATNSTTGNLPWENYVALDDEGFAYHRNGGYCSSGGGTGIPKLYGLTLRAFPRRQLRFEFQLLDEKGVVVAKFDVENPTPGPFPDWQPLPMPQTQTNGPVTLTLESLRETGESPHKFINAKWHVTATETNWSKARARYLSLSDATGNEGQWLSSREKAWKVRTQVFRERLQDFSADEYVMLTKVPVPGPGENVFPTQAFERGGVTLQIHAIGGAGAIANTNGAGWFMTPGHAGGMEHSTSSDGKTSIEKRSSLKPFLLMDAQSVKPGDEIRVQIRDNNGREIKVEDSGYSSRGTVRGESRAYMRRFEPAPDAKFLNLEIIVNRPLEFEFMVNPADVKSAKK